MTMTLVETIQLSATTNSIDFTNIPSDGKHLVLKASIRAAGLVNNLQFNNSSASEYTTRMLFGDGSSAGSTSGGPSTSFGNIYYTTTSDTSNTFGNTEFFISNYASSSAKSVSLDNVTENNATTAYQTIWAGLWNNTAPITSIKLLVQTAQIGSTISLYKIS